MHLNLHRQSEPKLSPRGKLALSRRPQVFRLLALLLLGLSAAPELRAQRDQAVLPSALSSNRFLFVVDISAAMKGRLPEELKVIGEVVNSAAGGQLRQGDTIGLWTFDRDIYSDLPLQTWNATNQETIAGHITDFLQHESFSGSSRFDVLLTSLLPLIRASDVITAVIISDGKGKMKGTAFDKEINDVCQQLLKETKAHPVPIVIVLQGRGGKVFQYTVNALPWPVVIPEVPRRKPPEPKPAIAQQPPAAPPPAVKPATAPPLIIVRTPPPVVVPTPTPLAAPPAAEAAPQSASLPAVPAFVPPMAPPPPPPAYHPLAPVGQVNRALAPAVPPVPGEGTPATPEPVTTAKVETPASPAEVPAAMPMKLSPRNHSLAVAAPNAAIHPNSLLIAGVILAILGFGLVLFTVFRGRDTGPSLITRSMNDQKS